MSSRTIDARRFRVYELAGGWTALAGKTDADNDYLSLRFAERDDVWFHAAGCPGSHVLLLHQDDRKPDRAVLEAAAGIAAWYSKARNAGLAPVSMCRAADVSKRRGSPPGEVTIARERALRVRPQLPATRPKGPSRNR